MNAQPQYNGNISWMEWAAYGEPVQKYGFQYDNLNRLLEAKYEQHSLADCETMNIGAFDVSIGSYDDRGNIMQLTRNGIVDMNNGIPQFGEVDALSYTYQSPQSNLLSEVLEVGSDEYGKKATSGYTYLNGNLISDTGKGITNITYNFLDLPSLIETDQGVINITYDASGRKLKQETISNVVGEAPSIFQYMDGIEAKDGTLEAVYHGEGRIVYDDGIFYNEGYLKDHLGNVRARFADKDKNGKLDIDPLEVTDENDLVTIEYKEYLGSNHYYPFGMQMSHHAMKKEDGSVLWVDFQGGVKNRYTYNGKEFIDDLDIGLSDYGARYYDPTIARWTTVDALADEPEQVDKSPYAYAWNNPVNLTDPDGNCPRCLKALAKTVVKSIAKGKLDLGEVYDIVDAGATLFSSNATLLERGEALFNLASPVSTKDVKAISNVIEGASDVKKNTEKARSAATTGQEAHRQIQKGLKEGGADIEVPMKLNDGTNVRKDAVKPDGTAVIIKPDTPSGQKSAKARENLMQKNGHKTETILYDPKNSAYQPGSPTYIGPKTNN